MKKCQIVLFDKGGAKRTKSMNIHTTIKEIESSNLKYLHIKKLKQFEKGH